MRPEKMKQPVFDVAVLQIQFDEGLCIRLPVSAPLLVSMLELRPGLQGVTFRKNLKFAVVLKDGRRTVMSTSHIHLLDEER